MAYDTWEAARLISWSNKQAGIPPLTEAELIRWIDDGVGLLEWAYFWEEDGELQTYIDFPTLVSLRLICLLRFQKVPLEAVTKATSQLREDLSVKYPYASKPLWTFLEHSPSVNNDEVNLIIERLIQFALIVGLDPSGLEFGADGVASAWLPAEDIKIDPRFVSGSPCVAGTRIPTGVLFGMVEAGDSEAELADWYELPEERIKNAVKWENQLAAVGV